MVPPSHLPILPTESVFSSVGFDVQSVHEEAEAVAPIVPNLARGVCVGGMEFLFHSSFRPLFHRFGTLQLPLFTLRLAC